RGDDTRVGASAAGLDREFDQRLLTLADDHTGDRTLFCLPGGGIGREYHVTDPDVTDRLLCTVRHQNRRRGYETVLTRRTGRGAPGGLAGSLAGTPTQ